MKNIIWLVLFILLVYSYESNAQCKADELCNACIPKLSAGFNFLKSYKVDDARRAGKVEYSYVFTKGTQYMITLCEQVASAKSVVITIYDSQRNKVASNKFNGDVLAAIAYPCNATGIYYLTYTFEDGSDHCAGSVLGFMK